MRRAPAVPDPQLLWPPAPDSPAEGERYRGELAGLHLAARDLCRLRNAAAAAVEAAATRAAALRQGLEESSALVDAAGVSAMQGRLPAWDGLAQCTDSTRCASPCCETAAALWPQKAKSWYHMQPFRVVVCRKHAHPAMQRQCHVCTLG